MRAKGEGTIFWDESRKRWRAKVQVWGKRRTLTLKAKTLHGAEKELRALLGDRDDHRLPVDSITLKAWCNQWIDTVEIRETTRDGYRALIKAHIDETWLGKIPLPELEVNHIQRYLRECAEGKHTTVKRRQPVDPPRLNRKGNQVMETVAVPLKLKPTSIHNVKTVISAALRDAWIDRHIGWNPARLAKAPPVVQEEPEHMSLEDAQMILTAARGDHLEARWWLDLVFGARPAEALGLTDECVFKDRVSVRRQLKELKGRGPTLLDMTKTDAGRRDIPIPEIVHEMLMRAIEWKHEMARINGWETIPDLVFVQSNGKPMTTRVDTARWDTLLSSVGLKHRRRYVGRHTAATIMLAQGMDIQVVSAILGHKKASFTMDRYGHALETEKRAAADKLGSLFG